MAEMLVRTLDKGQTDPYLNAGALQQYDVVYIAPDFWPWSIEELTSKEWTVLKLPNSTEEELVSFLAPELPPLDNPTKLCWRRLFYVNADAPFVATRPTFGGHKLYLSGSEMSSEPYRLEKAPYPDPNEL